MTEPPRIIAPMNMVHAANAQNEVTATDTGNTKLFVRRFGDTVRYCAEMDMWFIWSGTHWKPDVQGEIFEMTEQIVTDIRLHALSLPDDGGGRSPRERMLDHATKTEAESARRRIVSMSKSQPRVMIRSDQLNPPDDTLTCPNGVVDLVTGEIKEHDPARLVTACTIPPYIKDMRSDLLDRYLETFMPDPVDQRVLFYVLGQALRSGNAQRMLPLFLGPSTSGKSQLVGAVEKILAGHAVSINASVFRGNLDDKPRPDLMRAIRSRMAFAHEAASSWELHADQVKRLTGGDPISVRSLYKEVVEIMPTFTPIIVANEMPRIKGADEATRRRLVVIKFDRSLPPDKVDPTVRRLFENDPATQVALLSRMVAGAQDEMDLLDWSPRLAEALAEAFDDVDHIGAFLDWAQAEGHVIKADTELPTSHCAKAYDLHALYVYWVKKHGDRGDRESQMNTVSFGRSLRGRGWESAKSAGVRWIGWTLQSVPWL